MTKAEKILFITQEITPFVPETEISKVGRELPQAIQEKGREIRTFMPKWGTINERRNQLHEVIRLSGMNLIINETDHQLIIKVASIQPARMQVYFIDNEEFFKKRELTKDTTGKEYTDNDARAIFYARGVLETIKKLRWCPDIVHCQGWMSALAPIYIKEVFNEEPSFRDSKIVISIFEEDFKNNFDIDFKKKLMLRGISEESLKSLGDNPVDYTSLMKFAIDNSDGVIQHSAEVNQDVINYAKQSGKPFLDYIADQDLFADACNNFYDLVWESETK